MFKPDNHQPKLVGLNDRLPWDEWVRLWMVIASQDTRHLLGYDRVYRLCGMYPITEEVVVRLLACERRCIRRYAGIGDVRQAEVARGLDYGGHLSGDVQMRDLDARQAAERCQYIQSKPLIEAVRQACGNAGHVRPQGCYRRHQVYPCHIHDEKFPRPERVKSLNIAGDAVQGVGQDRADRISIAYSAISRMSSNNQGQKMTSHNARQLLTLGWNRCTLAIDKWALCIRLF